jgi:hypothetical protein
LDNGKKGGKSGQIDIWQGFVSPSSIKDMSNGIDLIPQSLAFNTHSRLPPTMFVLLKSRCIYFEHIKAVLLAALSLIRYLIS